MDAFSLVLFLFLVVPPQPTSTLFPYTTLFRSAPGMTTLTDYQAARPAPPKLALVQALAFRPRDREGLHQRELRWGRDRKSTRLNSSHQIISYAVFCLKKKK